MKTLIKCGQVAPLKQFSSGKDTVPLDTKSVSSVMADVLFYAANDYLHIFLT